MGNRWRAGSQSSAAYAPQQRLYFRPLAHGHGALRAHSGVPFPIGDILPDSLAATSAKSSGCALLFAPAAAPIKIGCDCFGTLTPLRSISMPGAWFLAD
jgi:hypothetical protein